MSKISSHLPAAVPTVTDASKRCGTSAADAGTSRAERSGMRSPWLASGALTTRIKSSADAPIDAVKVEKLRAALLEGSYRINAHRIADRLVDLEKALA